jgi:hypothetical protein
MPRLRTDEYRADLSARMRGNQYTKGRPLSVEHRARQSAALRGKPKSDATRAAMRKPKSAAHRAAMSAAHKARFAANPTARERQVDVILAAKLAGPGWRTEYRDRLGRVHVMWSKWEVLFAELLDRAGLTWDYEPVRIILPDGPTYIPDFRVHGPGGPLYEIKGRKREDAMRKIEQARAIGYDVITLESPAAIFNCPLFRESNP